MDFHAHLLQWYNINKRELPWRETQDPYFIWISEIIMQQTRIEQGLPYYLRFVENFKTIHELANANIDTVLKLWQGLGYYSRARNMHQTAKIISIDYQGVFPIAMKDLKKLPGIGDYTAAAIASICNNEKEPAIDGNLNRVISRLYNINEPVDKAEGKKLIYHYGKDAMQKATNSGELNQALMDFGSMICTPKQPQCNDCILSSLCFAYKSNTVTLLPIKSTKVKSRKRYFAYLHILYKGTTFLRKRESKDIWQGLYELPLIEFNEEVQIEQLTNNEKFTAIFNCCDNIQIEQIRMKPHILSHQKIISSFFKISTEQKPKTEEYISVPLKQLNTYAFPKLIEQYLKNR